MIIMCIDCFVLILYMYSYIIYLTRFFQTYYEANKGLIGRRVCEGDY